MRITTLIENNGNGLYAEHGLSLYLEIGHRKLLFDAGQSGHFADNAEKMGIDLSAVDTAILSHGHYDHGNGLIRFLKENQAAKIFASRYAFDSYFNKEDRDIGLDAALHNCPRFVYIQEPVDLGDGITVMTAPENAENWPMDHCGLKVRRKGGLLPDDFRHEIYLLIQEKGKRICITGCAHKGILNILSWFDPDVLIGGFHLKALPADSDALHKTAEIMAQKPRQYYTGHCTGQDQYVTLKKVLGNRLHSISSGTIIDL